MNARSRNSRAALTALACTALLLRGYAASRVRLLLWSGLCFGFLTLNNVLVAVDLVHPDGRARHGAGTVGGDRGRNACDELLGRDRLARLLDDDHGPVRHAGYGQRLHFEVAGRIGSLSSYMEGGRSSSRLTFCVLYACTKTLRRRCPPPSGATGCMNPRVRPSSLRRK